MENKKVRKRWDVDEISKIVADSFSYSECKRKMNFHGGNVIGRLKKFCKDNSIDTSHFYRYNINRPENIGLRHSMDDYLSNRVKIFSNRLRKYLIRDGLKPNYCEICGTKQWLGEPIDVELHHLDGNNQNNRIENLLILCSNCHTFHTRRNKNKKMDVDIDDKDKKENGESEKQSE